MSLKHHHSETLFEFKLISMDLQPPINNCISSNILLGKTLVSCFITENTAQKH